MIRNLAVICGLLLLANVVFLFWPSGINGASHVYSAKVDVSPHFVRLNKEVEENFYGSKAELRINAQENVPSLVVDDPVDDCFRLGPFMHRANYELAQAVLLNANIEFKKTKRSSIESDVFRVYLGLFANKAEIDDVRVDLKRKKILDHFVRKLADHEYMVSLGIYLTEKTAKTAVKLFEKKLQGVKLKQERVVLPDSYWLHFVIQEDEKRRQQLQRMDWGEYSTKLGKYQCQEA